MSATTYKTPGVYIQELSAFPTSIVAVATAVPVFIGYTEQATDPATGNTVYFTPVPITSMTDYTQYFGGAPVPSFQVIDPGATPSPFTNANGTPDQSPTATTPAQAPNVTFSAPYSADTTGSPTVKPFVIAPYQAAGSTNPNNQYCLYQAMALFFANGGGNCFVVSVGPYQLDGSPTAIAVGDQSLAPQNTPSGTTGLLNGLYAASYVTGATMIVIPEACVLALNDYNTVVQAMLAQAGLLQDRVAIIDPPGCLGANTFNLLEACQTNLANAIAPQIAYASYGAVYAPAVNATTATKLTVLYTSLVDPSGTNTGNAVINDILTANALSQQYSASQLSTVQGAIASAFPLPSTSAPTNTSQYSNSNNYASTTLSAAATSTTVDVVDVTGFQYILVNNAIISVSAANPLNVAVNGTPYTVTAATVTTAPAGTLTFATDLSTADAASGATVVSSAPPVAPTTTSAQTALSADAAAKATSITVEDISSFQFVLVDGAITPVSSTNSLPITLAGTANTVTAVAPGTTAPAGTLTLGTALAAAATKGALVQTTQAVTGTAATYYPTPTTPAAMAQWQTSLDNYLMKSVPIYAQIKNLLVNCVNVAPPSGILAGVWTKSDNLNGVWNAPANLALSQVSAPIYNMNNAEQAGFNVPLNGQAFDIIRAQPSRGNVVWGARTLDGNSEDYRYIQVRRTLIMIEQSIKLALQSYVFAANVAVTWANVTATINNFLNGIWQQGGLMGSKPADAYNVACGLGTTMTAQDILDGNMKVTVTLQMVHPAEFIVLTFTQMMASA